MAGTALLVVAGTVGFAGLMLTGAAFATTGATSGPPPETPSGVTAQQTAADKVTVSWMTVPNANTYYVTQDGNAAGSTPHPNNFVVVTGVTPGMHTYAVRAEGPGGASPTSPGVVVNVTGGPEA